VFLRGVLAARRGEKVRDVGATDGIWRVLRTH
jgi:hypothetical protein